MAMRNATISAGSNDISWEDFQQKFEEWKAEEEKFIEDECTTTYLSNDGGSDDEANDVNLWYKFRKAVLLIQAPKGRTDKKLDFEDNQRTSEYEHFSLLHPELKNVDPHLTDYEHDFVTVCDYDDMKSAITAFMETYGRKAKAASLYFNGYNNNESEEEGSDVKFKIKKTFLLIQTSAGLLDKTPEFLDTTSKDKVERTSEYIEWSKDHQDYCTLHPHLKKVDLKEDPECTEVQDYEQMKSAVAEFMEKYGRKAVAASMYFHGKRDNNKEQSTDSEATGSDGEAKGNEVKTSYLFKQASLLIETPTNNKLASGGNQHTSVNAPEPHPGVRPKVVITERVSVYSYDEMKSAVGNFMESHGRKAIVASMYFNGHGEQLDDKHAQLRFQKPMKESENLDTVLADLHTIHQEKKSDAEKLPRKFQVFFFQCYSYLHSEPVSYDRMQVRYYTSDTNRKTTSMVKFDELDVNLLKHSHHEELETHATEEESSFTPDAPVEELQGLQI